MELCRNGGLFLLLVLNFQRTALVNEPLIRAPAGDGGTFMKRGLRSNEVSALLRRFVGSPEPEPGQVSEVFFQPQFESNGIGMVCQVRFNTCDSLLARATCFQPD